MSIRTTIAGALAVAVSCLAQSSGADSDTRGAATLLPTGQFITPTAAPGSRIQTLNPGLADFPDFTVDGAISEALSPDRRTLLILTSGYNTNGTDYYNPIASASNQYVFVFDVSGNKPRQRQVIRLMNTYAGIAFAPLGDRFFVSGGVDDDVHVFESLQGTWTEAANSPIALGHNGLAAGILQVDGVPVSELDPGLQYYAQTPLAAGLAVSADGKTVVVANHYNDSVSIVDVASATVKAEVDLRPGKSGGKSGTPGGAYPFWVAIAGNQTAYVSSVRDREIVVVDLAGKTASVRGRIAVPGAPNKMVLNKAQTRLYVANDLQDVVSVIDTRRQRVLDNINVTAPANILEHRRYLGSSPDGLALSPDERQLYVSDRGTNAIAVIALNSADDRHDDDRADDRRRAAGKVVGLLPTGWSPQDVTVSGDGRTLFVINARSLPGPNPGNCFNLVEPCTAAASAGKSLTPNTYVLNLEKAGFQQIPLPRADTLRDLTEQVARNNTWDYQPSATESRVIAELRKKIKHVIYIVKENRTYDQVLGDLGKGNGDPSLTEFPRALTPNQHALADRFVNLDNFHVPGEVSGNGWPWSMAGRETDTGFKNVAMNYSIAGRGGSYDWQGPNRYINTGLEGQARLRANPATPTDPDMLPGTRNVASPDGPRDGDDDDDGDDKRERGYIWNAALRAGLTVRNYGFDADETLYDPAWGPLAQALDPEPFKNGTVMAYSSHPELVKYTDPYFRSFDTNYPDFYREAEWEREFKGYVKKGNLPALSLVYLMMDHTSGGVAGAISGVDTPETQVADNDYAVGKLIEAVANSRYAADTLIFIVEDDAQDGPDHVDAHRSIAFVVGPYVKQGATVSQHLTTINMLRTMTDVLGIDHLGIFDATQPPMTDVFDLNQKTWTFKAQLPPILKSTQLPIPREIADGVPIAYPKHPAAWWAERSRGMNFAKHDGANAAAYNRVLWEGLMGGRPYPAVRSADGKGGRSLSSDLSSSPD